jgi:ABC-type multidrug transport system ATPase subunit
MMKAPKVLFLDEPTSGLDAASAAKVTRSLRELAQKKKSSSSALSINLQVRYLVILATSPY